MRDNWIHEATPYCGTAPTPAAIASRWHFDSALILVLLAILVAYLWAVWQQRKNAPIARWRVSCAIGGWLVGALVLVSPLCALSVALFSARITEHMLLTTVSAPLIALGQPVMRMRGWVGRPVVSRAANPLASAIAFAVALWFWHAPRPYEASFASNWAFWAMQVTLFGTALWFWSALFDEPGDAPAGFVIATFVTTGQMGLLGAIITFSRRLLYTRHLATAPLWGMTPLQDQQLGGVIMWIPAGAIFALALVGAFVAAMRRSEMRARLRTMVA